MNKENPVIIEASRLREIAATLLGAGGFTAEEAERTAASLVASNLCGHDSHGVIRVAEYLHALKHGEIISAAPLKILSNFPAACSADAGRGLGQIQMPRLIDILLTKARTAGTAAGTLVNSGHVGRLGEWAEMIAGAGLAGFIAVNDNGALEIVAPPGGRAGRTSTNPLAFGIPLPDGQAFVLDMSTSAAALGKIRLAWVSGEQVAENLLLDRDGVPTTDPAVMFKDGGGALLPMGGAQGYKGFGLSMIMDCLAAGLAGGFTPPAPPETPVLNNACVTIWNPEAFAGLAHIAEQAQKYLDFIRATPPADPARPVRAPGDRAAQDARRRAAEGIPLSLGTCRTLAKSAQIIGTAVPPEFSDI